jgi:hypothetical protein
MGVLDEEFGRNALLAMPFVFGVATNGFDPNTLVFGAASWFEVVAGGPGGLPNTFVVAVG